MKTLDSICEKKVYTVSEVKSILGIGKNQAYNLIKSNIFHSVRFCGLIRVSKKSFDEWFENYKEDKNE